MGATCNSTTRRQSAEGSEVCCWFHETAVVRAILRTSRYLLSRSFIFPLLCSLACSLIILLCQTWVIRLSCKVQTSRVSELLCCPASFAGGLQDEFLWFKSENQLKHQAPTSRNRWNANLVEGVASLGTKSKGFCPNSFLAKRSAPYSKRSLACCGFSRRQAR